MKITIKGQEHDLTLEEIETLKSQLDNKLPTTWEECASIVIPSFYISSNYVDDEVIEDVYEIDKCNVPTEAHAKSVLAMCQLMTIAEALNRTCEKNEVVYEVIYDTDNKVLAWWQFGFIDRTSPIQFNSKAIAEHAIKHFEDLWYDYFMIEKP